MAGAVIRSNREVYGDRLGIDVTVTPEILEQFRTGYRCMAPGCWTVQDEPFPEVCKEVFKDGGGCGFEMRKYQAEYFAKQFEGETNLWPENEPMENSSGMWLPGDN
jgi:hypothetical protein